MTVLALMLILVAGLMDSATQSTATAERRLDAASMARIAFDRIASDLSTLVWDGDLSVIVGASNSTRPETAISDSFAFICRSRNIAADYASTGGYPRATAVAYMIGRHTNDNLGYTSTTDENKPLMLTRILRDIQWSAVPAERLGAIDAAINYGFEDITQSSVAFRPIGEGVIRMAVVVHLADGRLLPADSPNLPELATFTFPNSNRMDLPAPISRALDLSQVTAITVGLAILDMKSQVTAVESLYQIAEKLPRPVDGQLPVQAWEGISWDDSVAQSTARANLRFHQRTFPIKVQ